MDRMNDPMCLEDSFGNLARFFPVFDEEKTQEIIKGTYCFQMHKGWIWRYRCHQIRIYARDFEYFWSWICWKKDNAIKTLSVKILNLWRLMFRERVFFSWISAFKKTVYIYVYMYGRRKFQLYFMAIRIAINPKDTRILWSDSSEISRS